MPIAHLDNRDASFPRLGKIRKGAEQVDGKMGKDLDYFRLVSDRPRVVNAFREAYKDEPREIRVWLPYETPTENFDPWMKEYGKGSLKRMCDGNNQHIWLDGVSYKGVYNDDAPIPCIRKQGGQCGCKEVGVLRVMIVELFAQGIIGYFEVETHSKWDILTLQSNLEAAYRLRPNLLGIPFILRRTANKISTPMGANRNRVEKWLLTIEPDPAWVSKMFQDMYQGAIGASSPTIALPKPSIAVLPEVVDSVEVEAEIVEFISKEDGLQLWKDCQRAGFNQDSAKRCLDVLGIESFTQIPIDRADEVRKALTDAAIAAKYNSDR